MALALVLEARPWSAAVAVAAVLDQVVDLELPVAEAVALAELAGPAGPAGPADVAVVAEVGSVGLEAVEHSDQETAQEGSGLAVARERATCDTLQDCWQRQ